MQSRKRQPSGSVQPLQQLTQLLAEHWFPYLSLFVHLLPKTYSGFHAHVYKVQETKWAGNN